jgi:geranylgeranyl pyrophosphate synthase
MVEVHNAAWEEKVSAIPCDRRLLLLPRCLSRSSACRAETDELGLLCARCGHCRIPALQDKAEELGMMSLVAEGFNTVVPLVRNRVVDAVIGVGCLDSLEKAFPLLIEGAVPGLAVPLNRDGCKDTDVDCAYLERLMGLRSGQAHYFLDYERLKAAVGDCFAAERLEKELPASASDQSARIARSWLEGHGKRWRPYLLAAAYLALSEAEDLPPLVEKTALAVECFHKASLVHDDIQDNDSLRYGEQTVNAAYGTAIAINVGDLLLGWGYRLLADTARPELFRAIADAHVALCRGQGMELEWSASPRPLKLDFVLDIFAHKTVPAFEVALRLGFLCAGAEEGIGTLLHAYSLALGTAYQLQDDLEDFQTPAPLALRPSAVLAALCEGTPDEGFARRLLSAPDLKAFLAQPACKPLLEEALCRVRQLAESYHKQALDALSPLRNTELKRLLFRVTKQILKSMQSNLSIRMLHTLSRAKKKLTKEALRQLSDYVLSQQLPDGTFAGKNGRTDLYYTTFGWLLSAALDLPMNTKKARSFLTGIYADELDLVHYSAYFRCTKMLEMRERGSLRLLFSMKTHKIRPLADFCEGAPHNDLQSPYARFVWLSLLEDSGNKVRNKREMLENLKPYHIESGGYTNILQRKEPSTNATAAALAIRGQLHGYTTSRDLHYLASLQDMSGGFRAFPQSPVPDLLSSSTALFVLGCYGKSPFYPARDFIEAHWLDSGGFAPTLLDEESDVEYTFYGLMALGYEHE